MPTTELESPRSRGIRLRSLRKLSKLSRAKIEKKHGLSSNTLNGWECGSRAGLTPEGARRVVYIFKNENIDCSVDWLLHGKGDEPKLMGATASSEPNFNAIKYSFKHIQEEIDTFLKLNKDATVFQVEDDAMEPLYKPGDHVGGIRFYGDNINLLLYKDCIVEIDNGPILLRKITKSTIENHYNLLSLNVETKVMRPTIYDALLFCAAPITRIWRGSKW